MLSHRLLLITLSMLVILFVLSAFSPCCPQIHPDTHGCEYDYHIHHQLEMKAREVAEINLYEVSPRTFGGITGFEIATDHFQWHEPTVIYYSHGLPDKDDIPAHSPKGHPLFQPDGIYNNDQVMQAHYREFLKNGNTMRKYIMTLIARQ